MGDVIKNLLPKEICLFNESMAKHSTFGVGGKARVYIEPRNEKELLLCLDVLFKNDVKVKVIGNASNLLFSQNKMDFAVISLKNMEKKITLNGDSVLVSASMQMNELILWCAKRGLSGLENFFSIPGTVGGMTVMNAGAFSSEMADVIEEVEVLRNGNKCVLNVNQIIFNHHQTNLLDSGDIVLNVKFKLLRLAPSVIYSIIKNVFEQRKAKQPFGKSAGSVFRPLSDGTPAGKVIDELGLKNTRVGGAMVSEKHANFIINDQNATAGDIKRLIKKIEQVVFEKTGEKLIREIEYVGGKDADNWGLSHSFKV